MGDDGGDGHGPVSKSGCEDGKRGDGESHAWGFNWGKGKGEEGCSLEQQLLGGGWKPGFTPSCSMAGAAVHEQGFGGGLLQHCLRAPIRINAQIVFLSLEKTTKGERTSRAAEIH